VSAKNQCVAISDIIDHASTGQHCLFAICIKSVSGDIGPKKLNWGMHDVAGDQRSASIRRNCYRDVTRRMTRSSDERDTVRYPVVGINRTQTSRCDQRIDGYTRYSRMIVLSKVL
jgi:hypothetical protein